MKNHTLILVAMFILATTFTACKKGEDDPSLSLRSRKARVEGNWKVTSSKRTSMYDYPGSTQSYTIVYTNDGSTYTNVTTDSAGGTTTTSGSVNPAKYIFESNGTYTYTSDTITNTGAWNFTSGIGDLKNKSQITMYPRTQHNGTIYTGFNEFPITYDLKELRNEKMVWYAKHSYDQVFPQQDSEKEIEIVLEIDE
jgi:hypothetical protein